MDSRISIINMPIIQYIQCTSVDIIEIISLRSESLKQVNGGASLTNNVKTIINYYLKLLTTDPFTLLTYFNFISHSI